MKLLAPLAMLAVHRERWRWLPRWGRNGLTTAAFWLAVGLLAGHLVVLPAVLLGVLGQDVVLVLIAVHAPALLLGHGHEPAL